MSTESHDELGPIDIVVIAYPADAPMTGSAAAPLLDAVSRGVINVLDVMFVLKNADGTYSGFEAQGLEPGKVGGFAEFEGASSGLLGDDDLATAADAIEPGSAAVMIVYENRWAAPFVSAVHQNGGVFVDYQRIAHQDVIDALDAVPAS